MDITSTLEAQSNQLNTDDLIAGPRTLLAQPEPDGPTDEELLRIAATEIGYEFTSSWFLTGSNSLQFEVAPLELLNLLRAVLARWGHPTPQPVAVSERLPTPQDCDERGRCWMFGYVEGDWRLISATNSGIPKLKYCFSHWLPANALPTPDTNV